MGLEVPDFQINHILFWKPLPLLLQPLGSPADWGWWTGLADARISIFLRMNLFIIFYAEIQTRERNQQT